MMLVIYLIKGQLVNAVIIFKLPKCCITSNCIILFLINVNFCQYSLSGDRWYFNKIFFYFYLNGYIVLFLKHIPANAKQLYNIYTTSVVHCTNVIQMFCVGWDTPVVCLSVCGPCYETFISLHHHWWCVYCDDPPSPTLNQNCAVSMWLVHCDTEWGIRNSEHPNS